MTLLEVSELHAGYGKSEVLHGISVTALAGQVTAVIGPNGAGKSTLAKSIAGVLRASAGEITLDGARIDRATARDRARAGIGYTPQGRNVFADLTIWENLDIVVSSCKLSSQRVEEMFDHFPVLAERRRQRAGTLSGGERQQLAIACSLLPEPKLLVLDEPTTGLAPQAVAMLIRKIVDVAQRGTGVLWIVEEHPLHILRHCQSVYLMDSGQVRHRATGEELLKDPHFAEMFLGSTV